VDARLIVVTSESGELALKIQTTPEQDVVEILSPDGADQSFDERMGAGHEGYTLDLVNFEYPQVRSPAMESEQRIVVRTQMLWERLCRAVLHVSDEREPGGSLGSGGRSEVLSEDATHDVLVDLDAECMGNLLSNARTTEARIAVLHFEDRCDEFLRGPCRPWSLTDSGCEQQSVFPLDQCPVKTQQRRRPD
jgi:hypothetical protein